MSRRNLDRGWEGPSRPVTARLSSKEHLALKVLRSAWGGTDSEILRRVLREAAHRVANETSQAGAWS